MKSLSALLTAIPLAMTLFSCSGDEESSRSPEEAYEVDLSMDFRLAQLTTRSGRELISADNWQRVTDMRVYVFRSESGEDGSFTLYYPPIKDGLTGKTQEQPYIYVQDFEKYVINGSDGTWTQPTFEEHSYTISPLLTEGYYRFLAVGLDDPGSSNVKLSWTKGITNWNDATIVNNSGIAKVNEIFTGYPVDEDNNVKTIQVGNDKKKYFHTSIELHRCAAGVLLYLQNIPAKWKAEYGWTVSGGDGTGVINADLDKGDTEYTVDEVAVVTIGYNPVCDALKRLWKVEEAISDSESETNTEAQEEFIYDDGSRFTMTRIASLPLDPGDEDVTGGYHNSGSDTKKYRTGGFVLPSHLAGKSLQAKGEKLNDGETAAVFDKSLYLCFFTRTGTGNYYPLKMWPIKLVRSNTQDYNLEEECTGDLGLTPNDPYHYNLLANHLYCLGIYKDGGETNEPIDLKKEIDEHPHDDLTITVIGSWQWDVNIEM